MDGADYVHDEVLVELWNSADELFGADHVNGAVYYVYYYPVRNIYRGDFRVQQNDF